MRRSIRMGVVFLLLFSSSFKKLGCLCIKSWDAFTFRCSIFCLCGILYFLRREMSLCFSYGFSDVRLGLRFCTLCCLLYGNKTLGGKRGIDKKHCL